MKMQRALSGVLLAVLVTTSVIAGIAGLSQEGTGGKPSTGYERGTMPVTSEAASVPDWNEVNHTRLFIDTSEAPRASVDLVGVAGVAAAWKNTTFDKVSSVNATNLRPNMVLKYTDRFSINCTQVVGGSNYTVRLNTPSINASLVNQTIETNVKSIKIKCATNETTFAYDYSIFNAPFYGTVYPNVTRFQYKKHFFEFNISHAVEVFESTNIYVGASFLFEVNYTIPVSFTFSPTAMETKAGENFRVDGSASTRSANLTLTFKVTGPAGVNITFHYLPADSEYTGNFRFYNKTTQMATPDFTAGLGWRIPKTGTVDLNANGTEFKVEFNCSATIGFVEQTAGNWHSDGVASRLDTRTRKYRLSVISGPSTLLFQRVEYVARDISFSTKSQATGAVAPTSSISISNNTYKYYDPILEREVTKGNGTKVVIGRIQKASTPVEASFDYNAPYRAELSIRDAVRNKLKGAEVTLFFHGIRFGPLMSLNETSLQPVKITDSSGTVTFNNLPEGNFTVEVRSHGLFKAQAFSLYGAATSVSIEVVTDVPYQPWILVSWVVVFGIIGVLGIVLFKKKR
ncbi:MAG: hypothetical protein JW839_03060 [Candidatus Lokiarchaeota archaeon]|nr:hypothetical protein [Candidatus Lokiarchaeota archaeon]